MFRFQEALEAGRAALPGVIHIKDVFVWTQRVTQWSEMDVLRVAYYTSVVGDDVRVADVERQISDAIFKFTGGGYTASAHLIPRVQKKASASQKTKVVDVNITMDVMRAALTMPIEGVFLLTGDSDYVSLVREITRGTSKQVYLGAFSSGLASELRTGVEAFVDLDPLFFEARS